MITTSAAQQAGVAVQEICIDTAAIPTHTQEVLAAATLELIKGILNTPGGREALEAQKAKHKK